MLQLVEEGSTSSILRYCPPWQKETGPERRRLPTVTLIHPEALPHYSIDEFELLLELASDMVHPEDVACPTCRLDGHSQSPIRISRDGAFERIDYACGGCRTQHPIWVD